MTYLEKLLELNNQTFKKAKDFFAAKAVLEQSSKNTFQSKFTAKRINKLFLEYQEALNASTNLLSFINLNRINLNALL
ncbi:MAG: hypothetical protein JWO32_1995 [Bacteroidetes bacterium]|nr:hypothetical protein [Bacteroidota bacterium]